MATPVQGSGSNSPAQTPEFLYGEKGRYHLLEKLRTGGHGEIWRAKSEADGVEVVVKWRKAGTDLPVSSFALECEILLDPRFHHPAIVRGIDRDTRDGGKPFLVLEKLGNSLASPPPTMSWTECLPILRSLLEALSSLHAQGFVHHDVKPSNILFANRQPRAVKLCDFSAASKKEQATGMKSGTDGYQAPPDCVLPEHDDLWGLGTTIIQLFCGLHPKMGGAADPFEESSFIETVQTAYAQKHPEELARNVVCYLRLFFNVYSKETTAARLLELLDNLPTEEQKFPDFCPPWETPLPLPQPIAATLDKMDCPQETNRTPGRLLRRRPGKSLGRRLPWLIASAIIVLSVLSVAAVTSGIMDSRTPAPAVEPVRTRCPCQPTAHGNFPWLPSPARENKPGHSRIKRSRSNTGILDVLESVENSGTIRYVNGRPQGGNLRGKFHLTTKEPVVQNVAPNLKVELDDLKIEFLSDRALVIPTKFDLKLPLAELTNYVNRQTNKSFAVGKLRWSLFDPKLKFNGNQIKVQVGIQVTGFPGAGDSIVRADIDGEVSYELIAADRAVDQPLEMRTKLVSLRCTECGGLNKTWMEFALKGILRSVLFDKTKTIYPFRVSDEPVKSFMEHVTIHLLTVTEFDEYKDWVLAHGECKPVKRDSNPERAPGKESRTPDR